MVGCAQSILYWKYCGVLESGSDSSSVNFKKFKPLLCLTALVWQASWQPASCPAVLCSSLESCCGTSRWCPWSFPTLQLSRQAFSSCHQVTKEAADWDMAYSSGQRYLGLHSLLSGLVLLVFVFYWVLATAYTAWGKEMFPIDGSHIIRGICASIQTFWHSSCLYLQKVASMVLLFWPTLLWHLLPGSLLVFQQFVRYVAVWWMP